MRFRTNIVEKRETFQIFGKADVIVSVEHKYALDFIREYGKEVVENGCHAEINEAAGFPTGENNQFHLLHGIYFKDKDGKTRFMYGWEKTNDIIDDSFTVIEVPKLTWAVFRYEGKHDGGLPRIWNYIYTSWIYSSEYEIENDWIIERNYGLMRSRIYCVQRFGYH